MFFYILHKYPVKYCIRLQAFCRLFSKKKKRKKKSCKHKVLYHKSLISIIFFFFLAESLILINCYTKHQQTLFRSVQVFGMHTWIKTVEVEGRATYTCWKGGSLKLMPTTFCTGLGLDWTHLGWALASTLTIFLLF